MAEPHLGTHLAAYWLTTSGVDAFFAWARPQIAQLRADGRMFQERTQINVDGYYLAAAPGYGPNQDLDPVLAPDHAFHGLFVAYGDVAGPPPRSESLLPAGSLALTFRPARGSLESASASAGRSATGRSLTYEGRDVLMTMLFLSSPPETDCAWSERTARSLGAAFGYKPVWGGGFVPINPGSSAYLDDLD